jgi:hypothetical protein
MVRQCQKRLQKAEEDNAAELVRQLQCSAAEDTHALLLMYFDFMAYCLIID